MLGRGIALVVLGWPSSVWAQCAQWDAGFAPQADGLDASVAALCVFDDGGGPALYAGGDFGFAGGVFAPRIAKWNGTSWSALGAPGSGMNNRVAALTTFDDGGGVALYAGGTFTTAGGVSAPHVAKWDGASWSALGASLTGSVWALAVFDDGSGPALYAGGDFVFSGGVTVPYIAKWDGTSWSALGAPGSGIDGPVFTLTTFDDGSGTSLYVGGNYTTAGAVSAADIARWDGTSWSALGAPGSGTNATVATLATFDDGSHTALYAGGSFTSVGGVLAHRIARWDGASWSALDAPGSGMNNGVSELAVFDDGADGDPDLYAGGSFTQAGGLPSAHFARWHGCANTPHAYCFGDVSAATACPCANDGLAGHGCDNSAATGGAQLSSSGSIAPDALVLRQTGELASALSIFLQGSIELGSPVSFGDGLRCVGGSLKRLYVKNASAGTVSAPGVGDPSISARSAALGDPLSPGDVRHYQVYYRDPGLGFCPSPQGDAFNVGNALRVVW